MLLLKVRALFFLLFIGLGLTACDSFSTDSEVELLEDADKDIVPPKIVSSSPENDSTDVEVDSAVRFTFSELMNTDILEYPFSTDRVENINTETETETETESDTESFSAGVILYSGEASGNDEFQLADERPRNIEYSVELGVGIDPITNNKIDIDVTALALKHKTGRFALNTIYTVAISKHVIDLADDLTTKTVIEGNSLGKNIELSFKTEEGEWKDNVGLAFTKEGESKGDSELIEGDQFEPKLASNADGDVLAVWRQNNSNGTNDTIGIWASRYSPFDNTWKLSGENANDGVKGVSAERIDDSSQETNAFSPKIAINKNGKAVATWYQSSDGSAQKSVWVNVFDQTTPSTVDGENESVSFQWKGARNISNNESGSEVSTPEIGIDGEGNILSVWLEIEDGVKLVKARYYNEEDQELLYDDSDEILLDKSITLNDSLDGDVRHPTSIFSSDGVAMVAWAQKESGVFHLYTSRFMEGSWSKPEKLSLTNAINDQPGGASNPKIAIDNNNDAFVIWQQHDGLRDNIWLSRFSGGVWGDALQMEDDNLGDATDPFIAFGSDNQAFAVWAQVKKTGGAIRNNVVVKHYSLDTGWGPVVKLSEGNEISTPSILLDFEGNAIAAWINDGNIFKSRYSEPTSSWSSAPFNSNVISSQSIDLAPLLKDGRFINIWSEFEDGSFKLASSLFSD